MKLLLLTFSIIFLASCQNNYEIAEQEANEIANIILMCASKNMGWVQYSNGTYGCMPINGVAPRVEPMIDAYTPEDF